VPRPIVVPDVAGDLAAVRAGLPNFHVYDPPIAAAVKPPPIVPDGVGDGYESAVRTYLCTDIPDPTASPILSVYATKRRWRAIDVFVATDFVDASTFGALMVAIYAISRGVRTLVAQGRTRATLGHRVASARVQCDKFEVVIGRDTAPTAATQSATVTVIASDESEFSPLDEPQVGAVTVAPDGAMLALQVLQITPFGPLFPELVALHAINPLAAGAANDRWLMIFDLTANPPPNGTAPMYQFYLPAGGAGDILLEADTFRFRRFTNRLTITSSSTPGTLTLAAAAVRYGVWFR